MQITFAGQSLNFLQTGTAANCNIYTADISAYAGQTGQLLFTVPVYANGGFLDNIQFSSLPIPKPTVLNLLGLVGLLLGFWRWCASGVLFRELCGIVKSISNETGGG